MAARHCVPTAATAEQQLVPVPTQELCRAALKASPHWLPEGLAGGAGGAAGTVGGAPPAMPHCCMEVVLQGGQGTGGQITGEWIATAGASRLRTGSASPLTCFANAQRRRCPGLHPSPAHSAVKEVVSPRDENSLSTVARQSEPRPDRAVQQSAGAPVLQMAAAALNPSTHCCEEGGGLVGSWMPHVVSTAVLQRGQERAGGRLAGWSVSDAQSSGLSQPACPHVLQPKPSKLPSAMPDASLMARAAPAHSQLAEPGGVATGGEGSRHLRQAGRAQASHGGAAGLRGAAGGAGGGGHLLEAGSAGGVHGGGRGRGRGGGRCCGCGCRGLGRGNGHAAGLEQYGAAAGSGGENRTGWAGADQGTACRCCVCVGGSGAAQSVCVASSVVARQT